jgi:hypothetical protein
MGPKYPLAGLILLSFWNCIRALCVAGPKYVDSLPGDPAPVLDMVYPFELRNFCRLRTSSPVLPSSRFLVYVDVLVLGVVLGTVGVLFSRASVNGPSRPTGGRELAFWNSAKALAVAGPKYVVSLPVDPAPTVAMVYPLVFRYFCRLRTSSPVSPSFRVRVKDDLDVLDTEGVVVGFGVVVGVGLGPPPPLPLEPDVLPPLDEGDGDGDGLGSTSSAGPDSNARSSGYILGLACHIVEKFHDVYGARVL